MFISNAVKILQSYLNEIRLYRKYIDQRSFIIISGTAALVKSPTTFRLQRGENSRIFWRAFIKICFSETLH